MISSDDVDDVDDSEQTEIDNYFLFHLTETVSHLDTIDYYIPRQNRVLPALSNRTILI